MTTDSGLVYLSGLLRAGAEPLSPPARDARRAAAGPPHAPRVSDHSEEDDAGQAARATASRAGEGDAPAEVAAAERAEGASAVKSSEVAGDRHAPSPDVSPRAVAVESLPGDAVEGVELHAQVQSRAVSPSPKGARAASGTSDESHVHAVSPTAPFAGEARTRPAEDSHSHALRTNEIRTDETERTPDVTEQSPVAAGEEELIPATRRPLDVGRPSPMLHGEPNDSALTRSEIAPSIEGPVRRTSKAKTADIVRKNADEESAARGASFLLPDASSVGGASERRDPPARASQASREEGSPAFAGGRTRASEGGEGPADASAEPAADPATFTLEAHVEHLRALMRTTRAETPDDEGGTGAVRPPAIVESHRTPPLATAARPAREQPNTEPRPASEARPEMQTPARPEVRAPAANSVERQPAVLSNQEMPGASSRGVTSATEARPTTPRAAWAQTGGVSPARARGEELSPVRPARVRTGGAFSDTQAHAPTVAPTSAPVGPAPPREGGSTGPAAAAGGGRAPKLTINRLDVQVVRPHEPPPAPQPATPATETPPHADPWGALDRQLLGRFSY